MNYWKEFLKECKREFLLSLIITQALGIIGAVLIGGQLGFSFQACLIGYVIGVILGIGLMVGIL